MGQPAHHAGAERPVAVVTGATGGIGIHIAAGLLTAGHHVMVTGRDEARGAAAVSLLRQRAADGAAATFLPADHLSVGANIGLAARIANLTERVDVLVNNAGGLFTRRVTTADGYEATIALNFLAPVALTGGLAPLLAAAPAARCVNVVSSAFEMARTHPFSEAQDGYVGIDAYARAKLLTLMWTCDLAADRSGPPADALAGAFCANPGMAWTPNVRQLTRDAVPAWRLAWPVVRFVQRRASPERAARSPLHAATAPLDSLAPGPYIDDKSRPHPVTSRWLTADAPRRARDLAERMIADAATAQPGRPG